jgi:23S rRNA pseudouridine1911/1915/1917 synthase
MSTRSFVVSRAESGRSLAATLGARFSLSPLQSKRLVRDQKVRVGGRTCRDPQRRLTAGQRVVVSGSPDQRHRPRKETHPPATRSGAAAPIIRYVDKHIVVVDKPAGLTTVRHRGDVAEFGARARRFLPETLVDILPGLLARAGVAGSGRVRAVHRLDRDTSGLVVLARTPEAERSLGQQFRAHTIARRYVAIVRGRAKPGRIESYLVADRGDRRRGSGPADSGKLAITNVRVLEELGDYTVVECRLETGRTHQVRIHLGESGTPICGERVYDRPVHGKPPPDASGAGRLVLHGAHLEFDHPASGTRMSWDSPLPSDLSELLGRLRKRKRGSETPQR